MRRDRSARRRRAARQCRAGRRGTSGRVADQSSRDDHLELYRRRAGAVRLGRARSRRSPRRGPTISSPPSSGRGRRCARGASSACSASGSMSPRAPSSIRRPILRSLANRPIDAIASADNLRRLQLGIANTPLPELHQQRHRRGDERPIPGGAGAAAEPRGLYSEEPSAVTFLTPTLFRAAIPLPAQVPIGRYAGRRQAVRRRRNLIARTDSALEIVKGRLRAIRRRRRARQRPALRLCRPR